MVTLILPKTCTSLCHYSRNLDACFGVAVFADCASGDQRQSAGLDVAESAQRSEPHAGTRSVRSVSTLRGTGSRSVTVSRQRSDKVLLGDLPDMFIRIESAKALSGPVGAGVGGMGRAAHLHDAG